MIEGLSLHQTSKQIFFKYASFFGLIFVETVLLLAYKFASGKDGKYEFSPNAVIAASEFLKVICSGAYFMHFEKDSSSFLSDIDRFILGKFFSVSFLYAFNNTLVFYIVALLDPATLTLFKAFSPCLTAVLLYLIFDERLNYLQIYIMCMMTCALIVIKSNVCHEESTGSGSSNNIAILMLCFSLFLSTIAGILGARYVKATPISIAKQNIILYGFGFSLNMVTYFFFEGFSPEKYFFSGFSSPLTLAIIAMNTSIGFCMTLIYKYADVILKTIASVVSTTLILIVSGIFFGLQMNAHILSGIVMIMVSTITYLSIATKIDSHVIPPMPIVFKKVILVVILISIVVVTLSHFSTKILGFFGNIVYGVHT